MWADVNLYMQEANRLSSVVSLMDCDNILGQATFSTHNSPAQKKFQDCFYILLVLLNLQYLTKLLFQISLIS